MTSNPFASLSVFHILHLDLERFTVINPTFLCFLLVRFLRSDGSLSPRRLYGTFDADLAAEVILKSRGQVAAGLSVTRSFGDVDFKVPAEVVTAVPELSAFAIDPEAG